MPSKFKKPLLFWTIIALWNAFSFGAEIPVIKIDASVSPEKLPYIFKELKSGSMSALKNMVSYTVGDINGDGIDELIWTYSHAEGHNIWKSAALCYADVMGNNLIFQENGCRSGAHIAGTFIQDVIEDAGKEIILVKDVFDSIFFEITTVDSSFAETTFCFLADVGEGMRPNDSWHDLNIEPLAGIDLNGDGFRDFIYSQSAKLNRPDNPDGALERGVCAYDSRNNKRLWFFPTADGGGANSFHIITRPDRTVYFVFATMACNNQYSSNGMNSGESYMLAIDKNGREIWRRTIGIGFFYPATFCIDMDGDGRQELYLVSDANMATDRMTRIERYDSETGNLVGSSQGLEKERFLNALSYTVPNSGDVQILISFSTSKRSYVFGKGLNEIAIIEGVNNISHAFDIDYDNQLEYLATIPNGRLALLDHNFKLIASGEFNPSRIILYHGSGIRGLFLDFGADGYKLLLLEKQKFITLVYARYKWWLAVFVAGFLFSSIFFLIRWLNKLYLSVQGLPTLDRINAMAMMLDRNGKIVFTNRNPLALAILGAGSLRKKHYRDTLLNKHQPLIEAVERSYIQPFVHLQGKFDISDDGKKQEIEWVVYPRVDKNNNFLGKIIIAEDISGKIDWQRKVVLGDAAQKWVHKLKGSMATARITIENLEEDQRLAEVVDNNKILSGYLSTIKNQILETADTAGKILRFVRITKPLLVECDINQLIDRATGPYIANPRPGIAVAKMQQSSLPKIKADPEQIIEAIDNLLTNAIIALKDGGIITIISQLAENLPSQNKTAEVIIEDNGCGIEAGDLERIFAPGFSRSPNGTGIGLAIVKEIIDNHGWKIRVESKPAKGARFIISVPL